MIYFKSVLAGVAAIIVAELLVIAAGLSALPFVASRLRRNGEEGAIGWDPVAFARTPPGWLILLIAFLLGFWWQYRRLAIP